MRAGSVCSGLEAASRAVIDGDLDWTFDFFSEIDTFPSAVLAHHYPSTPNLGDFTTIRAKDHPDVELICGGPPCQSFSIAGKRGGLDDDRGNLTLKYVEMCHDFATNGSLRWAVYENVPGILSDKTNAFGCFISALVGGDNPFTTPDGGSWPKQGLASGPRARLAWRVLDAQYFGVAQRRRRVLVIVGFADGCDPAKVLFERQGLRGNPAPRQETRENPARNVGQGVECGREALSITDIAPALKANGAPRGDQKGMESSLIPEVTHSLRGEGFDASEDGTGRGTPIIACADVASTLNAAFGEKQGLEDQHINSGAPLFVTEQRLVGIWKCSDCGDTFEDLYALNADSKDSLCPPECERCGNENENIFIKSEAPIAFSAKDYGGDATEELSPTLRAGGHDASHANSGNWMALAVRTAQTGANGIGVAEELSHTLDGANGQAVAFDLRGREGGSQMEGPHETASLRAASGGSSRSYVAQTIAFNSRQDPIHGSISGPIDSTLPQAQSIVNSQYAVRRLTPIECERLQGFPDDFTRIPYRNKPADKCPDGPRYKALGNSWAVPKFTWLFKRIDAVDRLARAESEAA